MQVEDNLGHCKRTIDEHMHKLMQAAQHADQKKHQEMKLTEKKHKKKSKKIIKEGHHGGHHDEHVEIIEEHHESSGVHVKLSIDYETPHSAVMGATMHNVKRMHDLDKHRIHELEDRVRLLEHQAHVDYERQHKMIDEWDEAIEDENRMRMDIHKMMIAISHHEHECLKLRTKCHKYKDEHHIIVEKYEHEHHAHEET